MLHGAASRQERLDSRVGALLQQPQGMAESDHGTALRVKEHRVVPDGEYAGKLRGQSPRKH